MGMKVAKVEVIGRRGRRTGTGACSARGRIDDLAFFLIDPAFGSGRDPDFDVGVGRVDFENGDPVSLFETAQGFAGRIVLFVNNGSA